jgi:signal transduction histidine kinase
LNADRKSIRNPFFHTFGRLTRPHPAERRRDLWFQEEARAERSSNVIRVVFVLIWLTATLAHAPGNNFFSNLANLGVGGVWLVWSVGYHFYLLNRPHRQWFKYLSTTVDILTVTAMLFTCQFAYGYAYALKIPTFLNYTCVVGLAALRYRRHLAVYAGTLAVLCYASLFIYFRLAYDMDFGTGLEHTTTAKVYQIYILFNGVYLIAFSVLTVFLVNNGKRLVDLRVKDGEAALQARERAAIAANVAHEIKNPLEGIYGAAQLLKEEGKGNEKFIDMILKDSIRLNGVVQEFLMFSRPFTARMSGFDAVEAAREFCREQGALGGGGNIRCLDDAGAKPVYADPEGLRQALLNLYQNARRYQIAGKPVDVCVRARPDAVEISVEDDGEGVPEENRERLFHPFFTTSSQGTGLGLAISRKIAREMGGELYFEPKTPGARFVLILKAAQPKVATA